jgi:hypothetical protein
MRPALLDEFLLNSPWPSSLRCGGSGYRWNQVHQHPPHTPLCRSASPRTRPTSAGSVVRSRPPRPGPWKKCRRGSRLLIDPSHVALARAGGGRSSPDRLMDLRSGSAARGPGRCWPLARRLAAVTAVRRRSQTRLRRLGRGVGGDGAALPRRRGRRRTGAVVCVRKPGGAGDDRTAARPHRWPAGSGPVAAGDPGPSPSGRAVKCRWTVMPTGWCTRSVRIG